MKCINFKLSAEVLLVATFLFSFNLNAQVTIGLVNSPEEAALLQLKDQQPLPGSKEATATTGGLLLPRVELNGTDDFTLIPTITLEQGKDHRGLLVYNVREEASLELKKGVYQWDGEKWKMLNKITKTEGSTAAKVMYQAKEPDANQTLTLGIFEFRITMASTPANSYSPQFRRIPGSNAATHYWQVNEYYDQIVGTDATTITGSRFILKIYSGNANDWTNCHDAIRYLYPERNEMWLADLENDNIYQVQFMFLGPNSSNATKTFLIVAQKY
ncbi:MAG: hypothetical protein LBR26_17740 [Prevotella sp.]|jgi:hypothetical protein|nr:hypothetical protein [Prevotella sp.]